MKVYTFRILLSEQPEGGFTVLVPSLEGCITYGKDLAEAKKMPEKPLNSILSHWTQIIFLFPQMITFWSIIFK